MYAATAEVKPDVRSAMDRVREDELAHALRRLGPLTAEQREAVEHFSRSLMNKFLHEPSVRLRAAAANGRGLGIVDAARYLFGVGESGEGGAPNGEAGGGESESGSNQQQRDER